MLASGSQYFQSGYYYPLKLTFYRQHIEASISYDQGLTFNSLGFAEDTRYRTGQIGLGTTSAAAFVLEDCSGCAISGWGWTDDGYGAGVLGPLMYFDKSGPQTLRVQAREDGIWIDQIVLSAERYLTKAPGAVRSDATILPKTQ